MTGRVEDAAANAIRRRILVCVWLSNPALSANRKSAFK